MESITELLLNNEKIVLQVCSPYVQNLILSSVEKQSSSYSYICATEIDDQWIEDNSSQMDLFSSPSKSFIITNASKLVKSQIVKINEGLSSSVIFCDEKKLDKLFGIFGGVNVTAPAFWQYREMALFLQRLFALELDSKKLNAIEESIDKSVDIYWSFFKQLSLFSEEELDQGFLELIGSYAVVDNFKFVSLLNQRGLPQLFKGLLDNDNFRSLEQTCSFLSGHVLKVLDPSFLEKKAKLNKYEKGILVARGKYQDKQLMSLLSTFKNIAFLARSQKKEAFIEVMKASNMYKF